uniref:Uncharacterized protein n=1 Tax=Peronospora matthiolae TaxID=2874970 RepID=A0AAV1UIU3_9STRA
MDADFLVTSEIAREMQEVRERLMEIRLAPALPMQMQVDNHAATSQIADEMSSLRQSTWTSATSSYAISLDVEFFEARYVRSEKMLADLLKKALNWSKPKTSRELM